MPREKAALLARIVTERAGLWNQFLGLPENRLTREPVVDDWTAKDILAHVAAWDRIRSGQIDLILEDRVQQIQALDTKTINEELSHHRRLWPLEQVVEDAQMARAHLLAVLEGLNWDDITRKRTGPDGERHSAHALAVLQAEHDGIHAAQIKAWREAGNIDGSSGPKCVLVAALDATWAAFLHWEKVLSPAEWQTRPVCGTWTWQELLGHVADWERFAVEGLQAMMDGHAGGDSYSADCDAWSAQHAHQRDGEPFAKTRDDFTQARWDLLAVLDNFDDPQLATPAVSKVERLNHYYAWFRECVDHAYEHAAGLCDALENLH